MNLSNAVLGVEKTDTQSFARSRNHKRRRREGSCWTPPPFLVWVTLLALGSSPPCRGFGRHALVVEAAHSETQENAREATPDVMEEEEDPNALSEEAEALMNEFLKELHNYSYIKLIVDESQLKPNHYPSRGPPVMIGRRRSLLEHNMHHHYSLHYLKQLKEQQQQQQQQHNEQQLDRDAILNAKRRIQEALQAYLYQSPLDAHIKANPQRVQYNTATSNSAGLPPFPPSYAKANKEMLRDMFYKSYNSYMNYSFPAAELLPMTCQPGTFDLVRLPALTLIDALDTLLVLGDSVEFAKSVERLRQFHLRHKKNGSGGIFAVNQNVSVFETTIRVLGGLLSAHQMALAYLPNLVQQQPHQIHDNHHRNIHNDDYYDASSSSKLPPVFLKDVYDDPGDDYLVPTEDVEQILEQRRIRINSLTQTEQELLDGTCSFDTKKDEHNSLNQIPHGENSDPRNDIDWRDHCGAGVLALEDCAATKSKSKSLNQTAAAILKKKLALQNEPRWEYDGFLLELAKDIGERLFPAFDTRTGIPYGTVNLLAGVPSGETTVASLAGGGTLSLEFELLSRLTGDLKYGQAAKLAVRALWVRRSSLNLVGKHIDIQRGTWTENLSGIGSNSDSFLEYLLKHYLIFPEEEDFWVMLQAAYTGIFRDARLGEWYADVDMKTGKQLWPKGLVKRVLESLMAFYPGMQTLMGEYVPAARSLNSFFMVREYLGFLPERFSYSTWKVDGGISSGAAKYPLRPELLESCYFMHRVAKQENGPSESSSSWQWAASFALHHLERLTRAKCGYASVRGLNPATGNLNAYQNPDLVKLSNEMPSFFLSETIKYLYLTFDDDNIMHKDKDREWIFTTEAHPIHYVPTFDKKLDSTKIGSEDSPHLKSVKEQLRKKLKALKYHKKMQQKGHNTFSPSKRNTDYMVSSNYLATELWSDSTQPRQYRNSFKDVVGEISDEYDESDTVDDVVHPLREFFGNGTALLGFAKFGEGSMYAEKFNMAHLTWNSLGLGSGYAMKKACPNIYAPEFMWVQALNGGALDYTDVYVSAFSEEDSDYPPASISVHLLLSSAEALSVHGSGVYMGNTEVAVRPAEQCLIAHHWKKAARAAAKESLHKSSSTQSPPADKESSTPAAGVQQVELSGLGLFEVSAFPEGSGFFMQHVESGESITTSFIVEGDSSSTAGDVTLMVYASMPRTKEEPQEASVEENYLEATNNLEHMRHDNAENKEGGVSSSPWKFVSPRLASIFKKSRRGSSNPRSEANEKMGDPERAVVIADLDSNAFHCEVNVIRRPLTSGGVETGAGESASESVREDFLVASYPCAPALFGKTHISKLVASNGVFVERTLQAPNLSDEFGCGTDKVVPTVTTNEDNPPMEVSKSGSAEQDHVVGEKEEEDGSCTNKTIQLVQRGQCSFYTKAANQKLNSNADGVIVVNTDDDELFVMSYGDDEDTDLNDDEMPISVLVTGLDGEEIVGLIQSESVQANNGQVDSYLLAQISIKKQDTVLDTSGGISTESDDDEVDWPKVKATGDHLQIFAEGGWGIHAMRRDGSSMKDIGGKNDLQLFLLRHSD